MQLDGDYLGHPYFVTGHAVFTALARRLDDAASKSLQVSNGVFVPGEYGSYPDAHSQSGGVPYMGAGLRPVERYEDLFLFRDAAQRWLSDTRPRDAHNTHPLREFGDWTGFASSRSFGRPESAHHSKRTVNWYVHVYLHSDGWSDAVPLSDESLDGLRLGGARNYGFGQSSLVETQTFDLDDLDYGHIADADAHRIELLSPYVLASDYPGADTQEVPWWWAVENGLRRRESRLVKGDDVFEVATVDHGQLVGYAGDDPVATAKNGLLRVGTHAQYGFGEFRVRPASEDRVPGRNAAVRDASRGES